MTGTGRSATVVGAGIVGVATGIALLAWFIYAPQCISTLATIRRETHSWKQTAFATGYLFGLAYLVAFVAYRIALAMGLG